MREFNSKDFVMHRAIANNIVADLEMQLLKLDKNLTKLIEEYNSYELAIKKSNDVNVIYQNSKKIDKIKEVIIFNLAIKRKISKVINKNKKRVEFFNAKISGDKIPSFDFNQKQISKLIIDENIELKDEKLGLNQDNNPYSLVYFNGHILTLKNGELDLRVKNNCDVLNRLEDKEFNFIINKFPKILNFTPAVVLTDTKFRFRLFECLISMIEQLLSTKSSFEINEYIGGQLEIKKNSKLDIKQFIVELNNLLNVKIVKYLIQKTPQNEDIIMEKLKCNFDSEFLPSSYKELSGSEINKIIDEIIDVFIDSDLEDILNVLE